MIFATKYKPNDTNKTAFATKGESMTQPQHAAECDINNIMLKYKKTGTFTHLNQGQPISGDFSNVEDYMAQSQRIINAQNSFNQLPSDLRTKFQNDPAELIKFVSDTKNKEEAIKLGLIPQPKPTEPTLTQHFEQALENNDLKRSKKSPTP